MRVITTLREGESVTVCRKCSLVIIYQRKELSREGLAPFATNLGILKCPCGKEQIV